MIREILWVMFGGAIGSAGRFLFSRWFNTFHISAFPWATFIINITGCFIIGLLWGLVVKQEALTENHKLFLMTGICGGFTTFSAFSLESILLLRDGKISLFLAYSAGSVLLGFMATLIAYKLIRP